MTKNDYTKKFSKDKENKSLKKIEKSSKISKINHIKNLDQKNWSNGSFVEKNVIHFGFRIFFFLRKIKINEDNEKIGRVVCATQRVPPAVKKTKQISEMHSEIRFNSGAARSGRPGKEKKSEAKWENRFSSGAAHRGLRGKARSRLGTMGSTIRYTKKCFD